MVIVQHRKQQNHGSTSVHPTERTCKGCNIVFKSKLGLKQHQARRSNPICHRAGIKRMRAEFVKERIISYKKGLIISHESVYVKHGSKPFSADSKQIILNVYQKLRNKGMGVYEVCISTM